MTTVDLWVPFLMFFGIPTAILVIGFAVFFIKRRHRRAAGAVLVTLGALELSSYLLYRGFMPTLFVLYSIMLMTIVLGIVSLVYAKKARAL